MFNYEFTFISPFNKLAIFLEIDNPNPTPFGFKCFVSDIFTKLENIFFWSSNDIPNPVSFT